MMKYPRFLMFQSEDTLDLTLPVASDLLEVLVDYLYTDDSMVVKGKYL